MTGPWPEQKNIKIFFGFYYKNPIAGGTEMTVQLTYPGVYVEPIISPAPGDQGVATSLTAFVGRAMMGPVNEPILLNDFGEYEKYFGGLDQNSTVSYSVQQFFNNGGSQALMVRCFSPDISSPDAVKALTARGEKLIADAKSKFKTEPTQEDIETFLAATQASEMGINQWYIGQVKQVFDADMAAQTKPKSGGGKANTPSPITVLEAAAPAAVPSFPAFTGLLDVNSANGAYETISAMMFGVGGQATMAPNNRQAAIVAGQKAVSAFTGGLTGAVAADLVTGLTTAPATTDQPATSAAAGAYGAVGNTLLKNVVDPVLTQLGDLDTSHFSTEQTQELTAFKTALQAFGNTTGGASATLKAGADKFATGVSALKASDVKAAMVTAAGSNKAGVAIANGAAGDTALDAMAGAVQAAILYLKNNWKPIVDLRLQAASPGAWSNDVLSVSINTNGITEQVAEQKKLDKADLFNLVVSYVTPDGQVANENHMAVTLKTTDKDNKSCSNNLKIVLDDGSMFVRLLSGAVLPAEPPMAGASATASGGIDSEPLEINDYIGDENGKAGIYALKKVPVFNILCIPPDDTNGDTDNLIYSTAASFCVTRNAMLIIDPPVKWSTEYKGGNLSNISLNDLGGYGAPEGRSAVVYFPRIVIEDSLLNGAKRCFPASGAMAGQWSQADSSVGVWKAPAGLTSAIDGVAGLEIAMSDTDDGVLNPQGINCLRTFPVGGTVVWGARTLRGATALADEYRYVPVRRLLLYIMDWLEVNTRWAVFEPNDEKLWAELRLNIGSFMKGLYRDGALVGTKPEQAYFVRCDASTTTPEDQANGIVRVQVGFAPVKPAEFVVITVQQVQQSSGA
ncbi:MAG: phage tail sheath protein FI [Sneathiella sp.]